MLPGSGQTDPGISHHLLIDAQAEKAEVLENKLPLSLCLSVCLSFSVTSALIYALILETYS